MGFLRRLSKGRLIPDIFDPRGRCTALLRASVCLISGLRGEDQASPSTAPGIPANPLFLLSLKLSYRSSLDISSEVEATSPSGHFFFFLALLLNLFLQGQPISDEVRLKVEYYVLQQRAPFILASFPERASQRPTTIL